MSINVWVFPRIVSRLEMLDLHKGVDLPWNPGPSGRKDELKFEDVAGDVILYDSDCSLRS